MEVNFQWIISFWEEPLSFSELNSTEYTESIEFVEDYF